MRIFKEEFGATGTGSVGGDGVTFSSGLPTTRLRNKKGQVIGPVGEEAPANAAGGGHVAGIGVGPQGEPGIPKEVQKKRYGKNRSIPTSAILGYFRRKAPNMLAEDTFAGAMVFEVS